MSTHDILVVLVIVAVIESARNWRAWLTRYPRVAHLTAPKDSVQKPGG